MVSRLQRRKTEEAHPIQVRFSIKRVYIVYNHFVVTKLLPYSPKLHSFILLDLSETTELPQQPPIVEIKEINSEKAQTTEFPDDGAGFTDSPFEKFRYAAVADDAGPCSTIGV